MNHVSNLCELGDLNTKLIGQKLTEIDKGLEPAHIFKVAA